MASKKSKQPAEKSQIDKNFCAALNTLYISRTKKLGHYTRAMFAKDLKADPATITKWLSGARAPSSPEQIKNIMEFFNVDFNYLFNPQESKKADKPVSRKANDRRLLRELEERLLEDENTLAIEAPNKLSDTKKKKLVALFELISSLDSKKIEEIAKFSEFLKFKKLP